MKKLLALLLLFGIVGCASVAPTTQTIQSSHDEVISYEPNTFPRIEEHKWNTTVIKNYDDLYVGTSGDSAEAISLTTGERFHVGNYPNGFFMANPFRIKDTVLQNCERLFNSKCVISKINIGILGNLSGLERGGPNREVKIYYTSLDDYNKKESGRIKMNNERDRTVQLREEATRKGLKKQNESKRLAVINALKNRCISYGFSGNNNIAACVQREAQHDYELEQMQLAQQQLMTQQDQTQTVPEVPWYLSILEGVAEGVAEGYKQKALIQTMDSRYEKKSIYRYCRPNC